MYLDHFGLAGNPFSLSPKLEYLYKSEAFQESTAHLVYGLDNREAIIMITGAIGTGKTMALHSFMANLRKGFQWALVTNTQVTATELLKLILEDLDVDYPPTGDKSDLIILFKEFLIETSAQGQRVVIIIDEAQNLGREVLEEVRLLTNLSQGNLQPVQVILVGQPELEDLVNRPDLAQLRQRIRIHYRLEPLSRTEVEEYLDHRMAVAGCRRKVFHPRAVDRIARFSGGIPRLVNSLAGQALLSAFVARRDTVIAEDIDPPEGIAPSPEAHQEPVPAAYGAMAVRPNPQRTRKVPATNGGRRGSLWFLWLTLLLVSAAAVTLFLTGRLDSLLDRFIAADSGPAAASTSAAQAAPEIDPAADAEPTDPPDGSVAGNDSSRVAPPPRPPAVSPSAGARRYFVHIASFKSLQRAERYLAELQADGFASVLRPQEIAGQRWLRVYLGPYADREGAEAGVVELWGPDRTQYYRIAVFEPG